MGRGLFLFLCLALVGCQPHSSRSEAYYVLHPEKLQAVYERCTKLTQEAMQQSPMCSAGFKASEVVKKLITEFVENRDVFSDKLMHQQMALATLKETPSYSKEQADALSLDINARLAVIRFVIQQMSKQ